LHPELADGKGIKSYHRSLLLAELFDKCPARTTGTKAFQFFCRPILVVLKRTGCSNSLVRFAALVLPDKQETIMQRKLKGVRSRTYDALSKVEMPWNIRIRYAIAADD